MLVAYHLKDQEGSRIVDVATDSVNLAFAEVKEFAGRNNVKRMVALVVDNTNKPIVLDIAPKLA